MQVTDQQTQTAMFEQNRLRPHFVRGITIQKLPTGSVYKVRDDTKKGFSKNEGPAERDAAETQEKLAVFKANIEETYVIRVYDPESKEERMIAIDPRHPQSREQIKLAQDILEGRVGGLTPLRMAIDQTCALDPDGNPLPDTEITRVAEMEAPAMTRGQARVVLGGKSIGDWSPELDSEVDRACSFDIANRFSALMEKISADGPNPEWDAVVARGRAHLVQHLNSKGMQQPDIEREVERNAVIKEDFLSGSHVDPVSGTGTVKSAWDPMRSPVPGSIGEQSHFFMQRALIEDFQERMRNVEMTNCEGQVVKANVITVNEDSLIENQSIPVGKPNRTDGVTRLISDEKSRAIGTHLLAGYLSAQGATVHDPHLSAELDANWRLHKDVMSVMEEAKVMPGEIGAMYFKSVQARTTAYGHDSLARVEKVARACMNFPDTKTQKTPEEKTPFIAEVVAGMDNLTDDATKAGQTVEGISFGL